MDYFKKILPYIFPYKKFAFLNIFFNILYAIFSALSFVVLMPLLELIFKDKNEPEVEIKKSSYNGILELDEYFNDFVSYQISVIAGDNKEMMLLVVIGLIISVFLLKNIFSYLAFYFLNFLRNGVLTDLRDDMYMKTISLPVSYFSEKRKFPRIYSQKGNAVFFEKEIEANQITISYAKYLKKKHKKKPLHRSGFNNQPKLLIVALRHCLSHVLRH